MYCASCGTELSDPQRQCPKCGASPGAIPPPPKLTKSNSTVARVTTFSQIVGQKNAVARLTAICDFCRSRCTTPDHFLLVGPDGTGKRTIAHAFAGEMGNVQVREIDAATLEKVTDLTAVLTALGKSEVVLIQDIGSLRPFLRQLFLTALQQHRIDLAIGRGSDARKHPFNLNQFTCIATARRESDCPPELREAFSLTVPIEAYLLEELLVLAHVISKLTGVALEEDAAELIVRACDRIPHQLEILIKRLAKLGGSHITKVSAVELLSTLGLRVSLSGNFDPPGDIQQLTGIEFEELITSLLTRMGFRAQMTRASGDGGVDIVAVLDRPLVGGTYLIQCKRFASNTLVSAPLVREFYGAVSAERKAVKGILITTSGFTDQARDFAHEARIELIDVEQLNRLLTEHGMGNTTAQSVKPFFDPQKTRPKLRLF